MARTLLTIILAAGEGKRMRSPLPKVLHPVAGLPMVVHVLETASKAGASDQALVIGNQAELVEETVTACGHTPSLHIQTKREGTAHAVLAARDAVRDSHDDVVVLYGDVPLIRDTTIEAARDALADGADIVVLGFETETPAGYGRLVMEDDALVAIREDKDATEAERAITFCNSGIIAFRREHMLPVLDAIGNDNSQGEYYLTDAVEVGRAKGLKTVAIAVPEEETTGVNDRVQLAQIEALWQARRRTELMTSGVTMQAPETVWFHHDTEVAGNCIIEPNVVFSEGVTLEAGAAIRAFSHLEGAHVGPDCAVGPYARLRPGTVLGRKVKVGNFVETKKANVADGAKINHLSYVGDAEVGAAANIGAGTVTCNYDGFNKHITVIGEGAFIGTNTSLVAPVRIGNNANTAAGSVVYQDVPEDDLAIERSKQVNLEGKAKQLRARNKAIKNKS